jgi:hypothetical protein
LPGIAPVACVQGRTWEGRRKQKVQVAWGEKCGWTGRGWLLCCCASTVPVLTVQRLYVPHCISETLTHELLYALFMVQVLVVGADAHDIPAVLCVHKQRRAWDV